MELKLTGGSLTNFRKKIVGRAKKHQSVQDRRRAGYASYSERIRSTGGKRISVWLGATPAESLEWLKAKKGMTTSLLIESLILDAAFKLLDESSDK